MNRKFIFVLAGFAFAQIAYAGTFSSIATGNYNDPLVWSYTSDADGKPDADDDVTINSGHTITTNVVSMNSRDMTINSGGTLYLLKPIYLNGNYTNNGTETGNATSGGIYFKGTSKTISGSGTWMSNLKYYFNSGQRNILAGTTINKTATTTLYSNITVTNYGNVTFFTVAKASAAVTNYTFVNAANATLTLRARNFFAGGFLYFNAAPNTVNINYSTDPLPLPTDSKYYNLIIISPNVKFAADLTILNNFTINSSGSISANNFNVSIGGHFSKYGTWTPSIGKSVTMNGTLLQNITSTSTAAMQFQNLIINNPNQVKFNNGSYDIFESLSILQGNLNTNSRTITLKSDTTKTAVMGTCGTTATVTGNITFQRFIGARLAGYSDMSSPVVSTTFDDWDNEMHTVYTMNPPASIPSAFAYTEATNDYYPILSKTTVLNPGQGFEFFIDQDSNGFTSSKVNLTSVGIPNMNDIDLSSTVTATAGSDSMNLVGNPYHTHISWDALYAISSGVSPDIKYFDEIISDYVILSAGGGELLAPNQGFWIKVIGTPTFKFTEAIKSTNNSSDFRIKQNKLFGIRLRSVGGTHYTSGTQFRFFNEGEIPITNFPFKRVNHPDAPALSSIVNNSKLKVQSIFADKKVLNIPLYFNVTADGLYSIDVESIESLIIEGYNTVELLDSKTNRIFNLLKEPAQFFATATDKDNRFTLRISKNISENIAIKNESVKIFSTNSNTVVRFNLEKETPARVTVHNMVGEEILPAYVFSAEKNDYSFALPQNFEGIYLVTVHTNNETITKKLFK